MNSSTKGLAKQGVSAAAAADITAVTNKAKSGDEFAHLLALLTGIDSKGSEAKIASGEVLDVSRQPIPYPAIIWECKCVQAYAWGRSSHINVIELLAFLIT